MTDDLFREKVLRDLSVVVSEPPLLTMPGVESLRCLMRESVFRMIDRDADRVVRMFTRPEPRLPLGKWFERVFYAALRLTFPFADVRHSVSDGAGGELDFLIIENRSITHIECAVKFFLHDPRLGDGLNSFVGPGGQDRLDLKYDKMLNVQLRRPLPLELMGQAQAHKIERLLWMSGRIHDPVGEDGLPRSHVSTPPMATPGYDVTFAASRQGFWVHRRDFSRVFADRGGVCYVLPRQWWMTPLGGLARDALTGFEEFQDSEDQSDAVMVVRLIVENDILIERERGFVLPG